MHLDNASVELGLKGEFYFALQQPKTKNKTKKWFNRQEAVKFTFVSNILLSPDLVPLDLL